MICDKLVSDCTPDIPLHVFDDIKALVSAYNRFAVTKSHSNPKFALWSSYIDLVQLLLVFIHGTRESDWNLHISSVRCMLHWFFAYDRVNYARYLSAYWFEMMNLKESNPDCFKEFTERRQWTVQR